MRAGTQEQGFHVQRRVSTGVSTESRRNCSLGSESKTTVATGNQIEQMHSEIRTVSVGMEFGSENIKMLILISDPELEASSLGHKNPRRFILLGAWTRKGRNHGA